MSEVKKEWQLRCPKCGKTKLLKDIGGVRVGAGSKRTLMYCSGCQRYRCVICEHVEIKDDGKAENKVSL